jgi:hypothetical protein
MTPIPLLLAPRSPATRTTHFSRLTPKQQRQALERWRCAEVDDPLWIESVVEEIKEAGKWFGLTLRWVYFDSYNHATFDGDYAHQEIGNLLVRVEYPNDRELHKIAADLHAAHPYPYSVRCRLTTSHWGGQSVECEIDEDSGPGDYAEKEDAYGEWVEEHVANVFPINRAALWKKFPYAYDEEDFKQAFREFAHWAKRRFEDEQDHLTSDEVVIDYINKCLDWSELVEALDIEEEVET